jgi:hypothetical protein
VRRLYVILFVAGVIVVFVGVSSLLARVWSADGAERSSITSLVKAEASGDDAAAVARILGCRTDAACRARVAANIAALRRPGNVTIIQIQPSTGFSLTSTLGTARVAWSVGSSLPIVQCLRIRHAGDVLHGINVELLKVSARITTDADCPTRF